MVFVAGRGTCPPDPLRIGELYMLDKIKGGLFGDAIGDAIGDALGAPTEFMSQEEIIEKYGTVSTMIGGGIWNVEPGETTDDTAMTIAVARGIIANSSEPIEEIGREFLKWRDTDPKDIGITIREAFYNYKDDWFKAAEVTHHHLGGKTAGNGSLMRCLPVALAYSDEKKIAELTVLQSKMTHYDDLASEACVIYSRISRRILKGEDLKDATIEEVKNTMYEAGLLEEPDCPPDGFVVHTMKWVLYWLLKGKSFKEVVIGAANMGGDSDTIAAIAGGLKGLEVGFKNLPEEFTNKLFYRVQIEELTNVLNEIRDKDTVFIREHGEGILDGVARDTDQLYNFIEMKAPYQQYSEMVKLIREKIYLYRACMKEEDQDYDRKYFKWRCIENRFKRSRRLLDLGAPNIIILHELNLLRTEINHLTLLLQGIEPQYSKKNLKNWKRMWKNEAGDGS